MTALDLDALEREAQGDLDIEGYRVGALIQCLRKAEAELEKFADLAQSYAVRIAQLERVREVADHCIQDLDADGGTDFNSLRAALAAVEEK